MPAKILGMLQGVIASGTEKSRNNRLYTEEFWDTLFNSELFHEGMKNKVYFGQLFHPDDEEEYTQIHCDDRSAVVLTDVKKKNKDYIGTFEILPTKAGQCLRNLLDIGCIFGVSSRGLADSDASVFSSTEATGYDLITWDVVAFPGLKSCRLHEIQPPMPIAESLGKKRNKTKNKAKIYESLNNLAKGDKEMANYINKTLRQNKNRQVKEAIHTSGSDFDKIFDKFDIPKDMRGTNNFVTFDKYGTAYHNDGTHGEKQVINVARKIGGSKYEYVAGRPGDVYFVDNIEYNPDMDVYVAMGGWIKLDDDGDILGTSDEKPKFTDL